MLLRMEAGKIRAFKRSIINDSLSGAIKQRLNHNAF